MSVQKTILGAGAAAIGAAAAIKGEHDKKQKQTVGQKKPKEQKAVKKDNPANVSQSQLAAEKAKSSLAEHRESKRRSKNAIANFKASAKRMKEYKKSLGEGDKK